MKHIVLSAIVAAATLGAGSAFASNRCDVPKAEWQSADALAQKLLGQGWQVKRIKMEDGCYEAYAVDDQGRRVEAYFDPKTLEPVRTKVEG